MGGHTGLFEDVNREPWQTKISEDYGRKTENPYYCVSGY
jgi:hypothetical protein